MSGKKGMRDYSLLIKLEVVRLHIRASMIKIIIYNRND